MTDWSISNWIKPLSFEQFRTLVAEFQQAAQTSFGTPCKLEISALNSRRLNWSPALDDADMGWLARENEAKVFFRTENLRDFTRETWNRAVHVDVRVLPVDAEKNPHAYGHAEFKGVAPLQGTFHLYPDDEKAEASVLAAHPLKLVGTGHHSNHARGAGPEIWSIALSRGRSGFLQSPPLHR
jgi:hypothetical protein